MKKILLLIQKLITGVFIFLFCYYSYFKLQEIYHKYKWKTPDRYLSHIKCDKEQYKADSLYLCKTIKKMHIKKLLFCEPTYCKENSTIMIDTIFYNRTFTKLACIRYFITLNDDQKASKYIYEGSGYMAYRKNLNDSLKIFSTYGPFITRYNYKEIRDDSRFWFLYFAHTCTVPYDTKPRYNWNDVRFWVDAQWDEQGSSYYLKNDSLIYVPAQDTIMS